jgi:hypothetical protein
MGGKQEHNFRVYSCNHNGMYFVANVCKLVGRYLAPVTKNIKVAHNKSYDDDCVYTRPCVRIQTASQD